MNILITGANGQLGTELTKLLPYAIATGSKDLDITNEKAVHRFVKKYSIDFIINCAAYTAVDLAETEVLEAVKVNTYGPKFLAQTGRKMIHISTDYVFDGDSNIPYKITDTPKPLSVYGYTKLLGEKEVLKYSHESAIIRTSWVFSPYGKNFFKTMQRLGSEKSEINVVGDQFGTPTYAADLASAIVEIVPQINEFNAGIYHFTNKGQCSWAQFASEIMQQSGLECKVKSIPTSQYPTPAMRPKYSVLDKTKIIETFGLKIPDWKDALTRCIKENEKHR
ncbi:MAG: dTDP-4-dehydrorhamnose reductase [Alphaproteobacteria bacterium]|nr:dTDP-4-dehydrorhamnose reductase [Alphaproteobacteria bacterium]